MKITFSISSDTTCPNKCNVQMYSLNSNDRYMYSLRRIYLTKGDEIKIFEVCPRSSNAKTLYINCGSWNESKSHIYI